MPFVLYVYMKRMHIKKKQKSRKNLSFYFLNKTNHLTSSQSLSYKDSHSVAQTYGLETSICTYMIFEHTSSATFSNLTTAIRLFFYCSHVTQICFSQDNVNHKNHMQPYLFNSNLCHFHDVVLNQIFCNATSVTLNSNEINAYLINIRHNSELMRVTLKILHRPT